MKLTPKKITHISNKSRKEFLIDMLFVQIGISILQVALNENFSEGVKELHENKDRKEIKKIKTVFERFLYRKNSIMDLLLKEDLKKLDEMVKRSAKPFVKTIGTATSDMSLHYLAIAVLENGLARKDRKAPRSAIFDRFCDFKLLYGEIMESVEKAKGYEFADEWECALKFVKEVKLWI